MQNIPIQTYRSARDNKGNETYVHIAIELIRESQELKSKILPIRNLVNGIISLQEKIQFEPENKLWPETEATLKQEYESQKKALPAVTWSGTFSKRQIDQLKQYSGLLCIDIDKISTEKLLQIKERLKLDQYTFLVFTSPSGNGLKVIFKVVGGAGSHTENFKAIENYFFHEYNIAIDQSGKDVSRLCFLSFDPDLYTNNNSIPFDHNKYKFIPTIPAVASKPLTRAEQKKFEAAPDNDLDWIKEFTDKKLTYADGSRNNYIYLFACNCNRKGVDINDCLNYLLSFATDLPQTEIFATLKSAYDHHVIEAGKYAKRQTATGKGPAQSAKPYNADNIDTISAGSNANGNGNETGYNEEDFIKFWWVTEDDKRTDHEGKPLKKYNVIYNNLIEFLEAGGYFRLRLLNNSYQYISFKNNVCEPVAIINMKDYVFTWLRDRKYTGVLEMMRRGAKSYFIPQNMEGLLYKDIEFGKDTPTEAFYYFKNVIVCVTKDGTTTLPYTASQKAIWSSSMIQRDFTPLHLKLPLTPDQEADESVFNNCEMARYILLVSHSPNSAEEISDQEAGQRFLSICSSIGYMLHSYKSRIAKAIIAVDHKIPEDRSEQNGGSGKSIVAESFKFMKSTTIIDGREFKEDYPFRFEMVGVDTKIVAMIDCKHSLDFGSFFVPITNDFTYNRRHTGYITIPFADAPKWWFDTNFVFKGEGASYRRRMHVIEFDDYFSENHTPFDEFKHYLFNDWDDNQWNQFYNFYLYCVQLYLHEGLIDYPKSHYESRKLLVESPQEFIDFLDATDENGQYKTKRNDWFSKKELLKKWNDEAKEFGLQPCAAHMLTKWMKKYCSARPFKLLKDKTNGTEWWLLADPSYKGTGKRSEKLDNSAAPSLFKSSGPEPFPKPNN